MTARHMLMRALIGGPVPNLDAIRMTHAGRRGPHKWASDTIMQLCDYAALLEGKLLEPGVPGEGMDNAKVNEAFTACSAAIREHMSWDAADTGRRAQNAETAGDRLGHALWMCTEALSWSADRIEKKFRWLGFVQGVLWVIGAQTIEEAKKQNMPQDEEFSP